jgi:hypothetical protein
MGQAKQRGTFEERQAAAIERKSQGKRTEAPDPVTTKQAASRQMERWAGKTTLGMLSILALTGLAGGIDGPGMRGRL